jgi:hypothetical protein
MLVSKATSVFATKSLPLARSMVLRRQASDMMTRAFANGILSPESFLVAPTTRLQSRFHSSQADITQLSPSFVTKKLRVLNMDVVKQILADLREVDGNSDGRCVPNIPCDGEFRTLTKLLRLLSSLSQHNFFSFHDHFLLGLIQKSSNNSYVSTTPPSPKKKSSKLASSFTPVRVVDQFPLNVLLRRLIGYYC